MARTRNAQVQGMRDANRKGMVEALQDGRINRATRIESARRPTRTQAKRAWKGERW